MVNEVAPWRVLIVDDEAPARQRLQDVLEDIGAHCPHRVVGQAGNGIEALAVLTSTPADVVLVDIRMPEMDGIELARHLARLPTAPAVIFVTAYDEYAVQAFELAAIDYLLKPVRAARLQAAFERLPARPQLDEQLLVELAGGRPRRHLSISERGRITLVAVEDILYLRAELKYVSVRTAAGSSLSEESLVRLEEEFGERFLRIHRNCLVARAAIAGAERHGADTGDGQWCLRLHGLEGEEALQPVSRRQWPQVRRVLGL